MSATACRSRVREHGHERTHSPDCACPGVTADASQAHHAARADGSDADFKTAYAAADAAEKEAGALRNQWTTTESTLAAARKAAEAGHFDRGRSRCRRRPRPWRRPRSSSRPAKRTPGRRWRSAEPYEKAGQIRHANPPPGVSEGRQRGRPCGRTAVARATRPRARASMISNASAMPASCTSRTRMRSCSRSIFANPASISASARCRGRPPHLVGSAFLDHFGINPDSADAYAFTSLDFEKSAPRFGKLGGFAHLKTLIDRLRSEVGPIDRCCSTAAICGRAPASPMPCRARTWWRRRTCSASRR